ncbi:MAG: hypothetical protein WC838_07860, partial [Candidatus Margulisiibacteriota bacterium]
QKETFHKEKPLNTYGFKNSLGVSQPPLGAARPVPFIFFTAGLANLPSPHHPFIEIVFKRSREDYSPSLPAASARGEGIGERSYIEYIPK